MTVRFYWFDGKAPQGPFEVESLLQQPGFGSESIVCPVGSEKPEDWKAAVNYELLRDALFKPKPIILAPPPPVTMPCPACRHRNPDEAAFCNRCGHPMKEAPPAPAPAPAPEPAPAPAPAPPTPEPTPAPAPALEAAPPEPAPASPPPMFRAVPKAPEMSAGPKRGARSGGMGRIGRAQEQQGAAEPPAPAQPAPVPAAKPPEPFFSDEPPTAAQKSHKTILIAAVVFSVTLSALAAFMLSRQPAPKPEPAQPAAATPPAAPPAPEPAPPRPAAPPEPAAPAAQPPVPEAPPQPKRKRRKKPSAPALPPELPPAPEQPKTESEPAENPDQAATPASAQPAAADEPPPAPAEPAAPELALPGLTKKVRKKPAAASAPEDAAKNESAPEPPLSEGDKLMLNSAKEQFNFCHQLMSQGAFGDFYDACLCAAAKKDPQYKGRRRVFVDKTAKDNFEAGAKFEISDARVDGPNVLITAQWSRADGDNLRTEKWTAEEGLWCRSLK